MLTMATGGIIYDERQDGEETGVGTVCDRLYSRAGVIHAISGKVTMPSKPTMAVSVFAM